MATIDVIVPNYNTIKTLNSTLASIAMQKLDDGDSFKVTVVDDCSTDGVDYQSVIDYWTALMDIELIEKCVNEGCGLARQTGLDETDGDYVTFIDADDNFTSPFSLRYLCRAMPNNDMVMGQFVEDLGTTVKPHGENFTWMHGKMYRRSFLERHLIRFNKARGNEDVGFNTLASRLTDRILYIPQTVYSWNNNRESTVRKDENGYKFGYGYRDFIENLAWSCEEQQKRGVNKAVTRDFAVDCVARLYFSYNESLAFRPQDMEENKAKIKEYYQRALHPFVMDGAVQYEHFKDPYFKVAAEKQYMIPRMTYKEFIRMMGYFDDMVALVNETEI